MYLWVEERYSNFSREYPGFFSHPLYYRGSPPHQISNLCARAKLMSPCDWILLLSLRCCLHCPSGPERDPTFQTKRRKRKVPPLPYVTLILVLYSGSLRTIFELISFHDFSSPHHFLSSNVYWHALWYPDPFPDRVHLDPEGDRHRDGQEDGKQPDHSDADLNT